MKKNIKDYLHLYLGCDVFIKHPDAAFDKDILDADLLERLLNVELPIQNYKPILRPLSDMTEEDQETYLNLMPESELRLKEDFIKETSAAVQFLLSKRYDVFGLIEAGLAIDATKAQGTLYLHDSDCSINYVS